jgi:hypothetical protein
MTNDIKKYLVIASCYVALLAGAAHAQSTTPFLTLPVNANATFSHSGSGVAMMNLQATVASGSGMLSSDPLAGMGIQVSPYSGVAYAMSSNIVGSTLNMNYGGAGFVFFQDVNGVSLGWHIKNYNAWTISKVNGSLVMELDLEAPFWVGDPPASVSPTLVQMQTASNAKFLLPLSTPNGTGLSDLCYVGQKLKFGSSASVSIPANGYLYLFR